ncbi:MAG: hypothetical protein AAFN78_14290 [Pseudomonadota bacterium]
MTDDNLLKALAATAREDEAADTLDKDWDRYSAGELTEAEAAELAAKPGQPDGAAEAFRPLSDDFRAALVKQAQEQLATEQTAPAAPVSNTVAFPSKPRRVFAPLALAATVVMGVALSLRMLPGPAEVQTLPGYSASLQGGSEFRSDPQAVDVPVFQPGDRLELRLVPDTAVDGEVTGLAIAPASNNRNLFSDVQVDVAPTGAARVVGIVGSDAGNYRLIVAIGRADAMPAEGELAAALADSSNAEGPGWQAWAWPVEVAP